MNILYVAYAFPPVNIVASHRALFQAVYMARAGASVTVVCAEQSAKRDDPELLNHLEGVPGLTVHRIRPWGARSGKPGTGVKPSAKSWLWVLRAARLARKLIRRQHFDVVYSTYGPRYPNLAGRLIHALQVTPWVVEFRDPWHGGWRRPASKQPLAVAFERWLLKPAGLIVSVSEGFCDILAEIHGASRQYKVVYNGFDRSAEHRTDEAPLPSTQSPARTMTIVHIGTFYPFQAPALKVLLQGLQAVPEANFLYFGPSAGNVQQMVEEYGLSQRAEVQGLLPHEAVMQRVQAADAAFLPASTDFRGILPVKFYDYLGAQTPVLMIGGGGTELDEIMQNTDSGINCDTPEAVADWFRRLLAGEVRYSFRGAEFFTRQQQAEQLLSILASHVSKK